MGALTATTRVLIFGKFTNSLDLSEPIEPLGLVNDTAFTNGTSANQANQIWSDTRTAAASTDSLDLTGGLTDAFGSAITFAKVKGIYMVNKSTTSGETLILGGIFMGVMLGGLTQTINVEAGATLLLTAPVDGFAVTNGITDQITVNPGGNTITYDVAIIGTV